MSLKDIFTQAQAENLSKNDTIMKLAEEIGDITRAVRAYSELAREAGLILPYKDRVVKVNEYLDDETGRISDAEERSNLAKELADKFGISDGTAQMHIRTYAHDHGIDIPTRQRNTLEFLVNFVQKYGKDADKTEVIAGLVDQGYTENSAKSAYSRAMRELGWVNGRQVVSVEDLVAFCIDNESLPKKSLAKKLAEQFGYSDSTANSYMAYHTFAQEYHRQRTES